MIQSPEGDLSPFNFDEVLRQVPELNQLDCDIETIQAWEPLDSSDINHNHWIKLADILNENRDQYDGFVILHGTDTMAYTASALSFILKDFSKPIILTGSQLPIGVLRSDGRENLITSVELVLCRLDMRLLQLGKYAFILRTSYLEGIEFSREVLRHLRHFQVLIILF